MACMIPTHTVPLNIFTDSNYIGIRSSGLDYDRTLLLLVGEVVLNVFLYTENMCVLYSQNVISCL